MAWADGLKEVYFSMEDRYYAVLDKIEARGIPVYPVVDRIDAVVPSFALLLGILLLIVLGIFWILVSPFLIFGNASLLVKVTDFENNPISGVHLTLLRGELQANGDTNALGRFEFRDIPRTSTVKVSAIRDGYDPYESDSISMNEDKTISIRLNATGASAGGEAVSRTIRLLQQNGQPVTENVTLSFLCSNRDATPPQDISTSNGEAVVVEPANCGGLLATIRSENYREIPSQPINRDVQTVYLVPNSASLDGDRGTIEVTVLENNSAAQDGIDIVLYAFDSDSIIDQVQTQNGKAIFSQVPFGSYVVRNKTTTLYGVSTVSVTLNAARQTATLTLQQNVVGRIKIKVVDELSHLVVSNAAISLRKDNAELEKKVTGTDNNGFVEFFVSADVAYSVGISAADYCFEQRSDLHINPGSYVINMKRFSASCGGVLVVRVIDQDGKPVSNATVSLGTEDQFFIGRSPAVSDVNGTAKFSGMPSGTYTAFAFKGSSSGWSDPAYFSRKKGEAEETDLIATLNIPDAVLRVHAVDKDNEPVPFARISFYDSFDNKLVGGGAKPMDGNGILEWTTRADKKFFMVVEKDGYASFVSPVIELKPTVVQDVTASLLPPVTQFKVDLIGLFRGNLSAPSANSAAASLAAGQEYVGRFRIFVPAENVNGNAKFNELGFHLRSGNDSILERDLLFIKETNMPRANMVRSTSFTGDFASDMAQVTNSDAKWLNAIWPSALGSVIEIEAVIKIKENAALGKKLDLYYRAWGKNSSLVRDPPDTTGNDQDLYADAKIASFQVGVGTLCDDRFCFDASVLDQNTLLRTPILNDSFLARNFAKYTLSFTIGNASSHDTDTYPNAELRISNAEENLSLSTYTIFDASEEGSRPVTGNAAASELPRIPIGNLSPGRKISGELAFSPKDSGNATLEFLIVDRDLGQIVFTKQLNIVTSADRDFELTIVPSVLTPGVENPAVFTVTDKESGLPVADATVRIKDKFGHIIQLATTNSLGNVEIVIPGQAPGSVLTVEIQRIGFNNLVRQITVDSDVFVVKPDRLGFSVNPKTKPTDSRDLNIANVSPFDLTIESLSIDGKFDGLVDEIATNNGLEGSVGTVIVSNDFIKLPIVVQVSPAATSLTELTEVSGNLRLRLGGLGTSWETTIPVQITIGLGGEVDDPNCLTLSQTDWTAGTQGRPVTLEFRIQNNCAILGKPAELQGLEAKIQWESNQVGEYQLITDKSNSILRSGYYLTIYPTLSKQADVVAKLTFTPNAKVFGDAKATILFQASNPTDTAPQTLTAQMTTQVSIVNLLNCVSFDKEALEMQADETFTAKTTAFGQVISTASSPSIITGQATQTAASNTDSAPETQNQNTSVPDTTNPYRPAVTAPVSRVPSAGILSTGAAETFTVSTAECGGETSFRLESELQVNPTEFILQNNSSQRVTVQGNDKIPGQYGVKVSIEGAGAKNAAQIRTIPVILKPSLNECVLLSKFEFNVYDDPLDEGDAADTARVINQCYDKPVAAFIDKHSLHDAMKDGQKWAAVGLMMGMLGTITQNGGLSNGLFGGGNGSNDDKKNNADAKATDFKKGDMVRVRESSGQITLMQSYKFNNKLYIEEGQNFVPVRELTTEKGIYVRDTASSPVPTNPTGSNPTTPAANPSATPNTTNTNTQQLQQQLDQLRINRGVIFSEYNTKKAANASEEELKSYTDQLAQMDSEINNLQAQISNQQAPTGQFLLPWTGLQVFPFGSISSDSDSPDFAECGVELTNSQDVLDRRQEDEEELASMTLTMPLMGAMLGGSSMMNPFSQALMMYAQGTAQAYNAQEDLCIATIQRDVQLGNSAGIGGLGLGGDNGGILGGLGGDLFGNGDSGGGDGGLGGILGGDLSSYFTGETARGVYKLLQSSGLDDALFEGMSVQEYQKPVLGPRADNRELRIETRFIKISNDEALVQEDALNPLYAVLNIKGIRHQYIKDQVYESEAPNQLKEADSEAVSSKFHLQLNSFKPEFDVSISPEIGNCQIGALVGSTGPQAVPKLLLDWGWNAIPENACDADAENPDYVYCDSAQFSIALLKKINILREFTTENASQFECPSTINEAQPVQQTLAANANDLGITRLETIRTGSDVNVVSTIENKNNLNATMILTTVVTRIDNQGVVKTCEQTVNVLSKSTAGCVVPDLVPGEYRAFATLSNIDCPACEDALQSNNSLEMVFTTGLGGILADCDTISTTLLADFISATEAAGKTLTYPTGYDKEKIAKLANFKAHLMADGYSDDFRKDFDEFAKNRSFFQTPQFYSEDDGLSEYFVDTSKMKFGYLNGPNNPLSSPGIFQVVVDVNFSDRSWKWFDRSSPAAQITIGLEKTNDESPQSPFYYYPLDGQIGIDKGRIGYGTSFTLASPDQVVRINNNPTQAIIAQEVFGSIPAGSLRAFKVTDFASLNVNNRGSVMSIDSQSGELRLSPSLATPVLLKIDSVQSNDAFAFYSLEVDSQPQTNLPYLSRWNGANPSCKDFVGDGLDKVSDSPDLGGLNSHCAALGANEATSFGFEWCNKKFPGSVVLESVFFTPADSKALLRVTGSNESAELVGLAGNADQLELGGAPGVALDSGSSKISSVEDVLNLVRQGLVCVTGSSNAVHTDFFWNPKPILDTLKTQAQDATAACIS